MLAASSVSSVLIELGLVLLVLAVCGRFAARLGLPSTPLYLLAGLALGEGSPVALEASTDFIRIGADLGVVLLLLLLGIEYSPAELSQGMRQNWLAGLVDFGASFAPGALAGWLLGWGGVESFLLGGITYVTSSGIVAKAISDLGRIGNRETPVVLSILVMEDIVMAIYLPIAGVLLVGASFAEGSVAVALALAVVAVALVVALRMGRLVSRIMQTDSAELLLLTLLGATFLAAGLADRANVSAAVGAFLIGVTLSGQIADRGRELLAPIRDVFGGMFFIFFGLQIDPAELPPVLLPAIALAVVAAASKVATGWWAARRAGIGVHGRRRAAAALVPRGEFSVVIAGIGTAAGIEPQLGPLAACLVLILAFGGTVAMRFAE
jgi:CPA2 family monovalent cation:H+ antiporter-2